MDEHQALWREKDAAWKGQMGAIIKGLNKNQDQLWIKLAELSDKHIACRENVLQALAVLQAQAKQQGWRWGLLAGGIISIFTSLIVGFIFSAVLP